MTDQQESLPKLPNLPNEALPELDALPQGQTPSAPGGDAGGYQPQDPETPSLRDLIPSTITSPEDAARMMGRLAGPIVEQCPKIAETSEALADLLKDSPNPKALAETIAAGHDAIAVLGGSIMMEVRDIDAPTAAKAAVELCIETGFMK